MHTTSQSEASVAAQLSAAERALAESEQRFQRVFAESPVGMVVVGPEPELPVITLSPELERILHQSLQAGGGDGAGIEPGLAERMQRSLVEATQRQELEGQPAVLLTSGILRNTLAKFVKNAIPGLRVLSYQEVPDDKQIRIVSAVGQG